MSARPGLGLPTRERRWRPADRVRASLGWRWTGTSPPLSPSDWLLPQYHLIAQALLREPNRLTLAGCAIPVPD